MDKISLYLNESFLMEKTDHKEMEKWKADIRKLTKIYNDINTDEKLKEAHKIFITFSNNFEKWVFKTLLKDDKKTESQTQIRKLGWAAFLEFQSSDMFPQTYNFKTETHELDLNKVLKNKEKSLRRIQKMLRDFFKAVTEYFDDGFNPSIDNSVVINSYGINFVIDTSIKDHEELLNKFFKSSLPTQLKLLDKKGFKRIYKDLTVEIKKGLSEEGYSMAGGLYDRSKDRLLLGMLGLNDYTLIHELGHRLYFKMSPRTRTIWEEQINSLTDTITEKDFNLFYDKYILKEEHIIINDNTNPIKNIVVKEHDPILQSKFLFIQKSLKRLSFFMWKEGDFKNIRRKLSNIVVDQKMHLGFKISTYATTDAYEGFAEAFTYFITKPRRLNLFIKSILFNTLRAGGYAITEDVEKSLDRKLNII